MTLAAVAGLGVYFASVGLDNADKLGSVIGALVAVAGLSLTVYGLVAASGGGRRLVQQTARASGGRISQVGGDQTGAASLGRDAAAEVRQRARAYKDGEISQVAGDQAPPAQP
ncbi:hypothetical protein ITP53_54875 [Nonomuraea sp. K274]|uniref:Uncharacterized protein n=1 Tax=Nonomuraea cypriaca TaxID=1187855 RepID=A0A931AMK1_9ACTN|nr:hypothetical protein [Nonomuraea cypriaca]MBF8194595.1 hypothetical protein [Nonomuraea cypriaca]